MIGYEGFIGDYKEEGEFLEDGNLGNAVDGYSLEISGQILECDGDGRGVGWTHSSPPSRVAMFRDEYAVVCAHGEHGVTIRLIEGNSAIDRSPADWLRPRPDVVETILDLADSSVKWSPSDDYAFAAAGHGIITKRGVCDDSQSEWLRVLFEQRSRMSGFRLDNFVTPVLPVLRRRCVQRIKVSLTEVSDPEREHKSLILRAVQHGACHQCFPR